MAKITVQHIAALVKGMDRINNLKLEGDVAKEYGAATKTWNDAVQDLVENVTEADTTFQLLVKDVQAHVSKVLKANEEAKKEQKQNEQSKAALLGEMKQINDLTLAISVTQKYGELNKKYNSLVHDFVTAKSFDAKTYPVLYKKVSEHVQEVLKANVEAQKQDEKAVKFKFTGSKSASREEATVFIETHLPKAGHVNISKALTAVEGGGKPCGKLSGIQHASAGVEGTEKACTIFFKKGAPIEIVAIGKHEKVEKTKPPEYHIYWSSDSGLKAKSVFVLKK